MSVQRARASVILSAEHRATASQFTCTRSGLNPPHTHTHTPVLTGRTVLSGECKAGSYEGKVGAENVRGCKPRVYSKSQTTAAQVLLKKVDYRPQD